MILHYILNYYIEIVRCINLKKNDAFKYLFNKIYNGGKLIRLIVTRSRIKALGDYYKKNFESTYDYSLFISKLGKLKTFLQKSKSAEAEFKKQFMKRMALQPAILCECFVSQTLANVFELDNFIDVDEKEENIPTHLFKALIKSKGGDLEAAMPRYIYFCDKKGIVLLQYGDSSSIDAVFVKDGYRVRLEIKDEKAKLGEYDLNYDENGKLIPTQNILDYHTEYMYFINEFNSFTNVFDNIGRNFKIGCYLTEEIVMDIVSSVFDFKKIDLYVLQKDDTIFTVPKEQLLRCVDLSKGSEIRTAGRNSYTVFTPNRLNELIFCLGGNIKEGVVTLPFDSSKASKGRGKQTITRYKLNSLFFVKYSDIIIQDDKISFELKNVRQNKATISLHMYSIINKKALEDSYKSINS